MVMIILYIVAINCLLLSDYDDVHIRQKREIKSVQ
jgi:hypothetical protein